MIKETLTYTDKCRIFYGRLGYDEIFIKMNVSHVVSI
jgi:hypothetical protein